jgi:glycerol-3-phosphate dehydrogenase
MRLFWDFSRKTREKAIDRFQNEEFDLLVIGGGITGAATARDAVSRGLKVALVEARDFAWGTSSRSSKLIHGGVRYLENMELGLVFEALSERAKLLKLVPHLVRPLKFFMPVYQGDKPGKFLLSIGLWLYDILSLFRTPGFHRRLSKKKLLSEIPFLSPQGLEGGFQYYDASMWDDVLAIETLRSAAIGNRVGGGAAVANYVEAVAPIWVDARIVGFQVKDLFKTDAQPISLRAKRVVVCAGPWTDQLGIKLSPHWRHWLTPSKGIHLIFDLKKIPVPGAIVMSHPDDGRISFVIPRPDYGAGVTIVGTTDGPTPPEPEKASIEPADVHYLINLLTRYFPTLQLKASDIVSAYVGVRPLMGAHAAHAMTGSEGQSASAKNAEDLQKVSREHYIGTGPGGVILVAGGKYTTHRTMAEEIVDFTLEAWQRDAKKGLSPELPKVFSPQTDLPVNPKATPIAVAAARDEAQRKGYKIPEELWSHYGADALEIREIDSQFPKLNLPDPDGFPLLAAQFRYSLRTGMVMHLEDFFIRRTSLYATREDHGLPWAAALSKIWASEMELPESAAQPELAQLQAELERRSEWKKRL